jgi:hypothetical protein
MHGAIPPLPNTPLWRGAHLKHRDNFTFTTSSSSSSDRSTVKELFWVFNVSHTAEII